MSNLDLTADIIDVRDIIERIDELETEIVTFNDDEDDEKRATDWRKANPEESEELNNLLTIMAELESVGGGDEQWRGDWFPLTLIADSYFTDYARELCEEIGDIPKELPHYIAIDWNATARNIRVDYTPVIINGATYWTR